MEPNPETEPLHIQLGAPSSRCRSQRFLDGALEITSAHGVARPDVLLVHCLGGEFSGRVLVVGSREGVVALAAARLHESAEVHLQLLDAYERHRVAATIALNEITGVRVLLQSDLARDASYDWVIFPARHTGEAVLAGELLRQAFVSLKKGGKLLAASDDPGDSWLRGQMEEVFGSVTIHWRGEQGTVYIARKRDDKPPRERRYRREFRAKLFGQEVALESRPSVFSHGELDEGTLALSEMATLREDSVVADLGCGSGAIGVAAALAAPRGLAVLVDSNLRAVEASQASVRRAGVQDRALVVLSCDLDSLRSNAFDLVLANPPYFSDYRIAELFVSTARRILKRGGELLLVTKAPERPSEIVGATFAEFEPLSRRGYTVFKATKT